MKKYQKKIKKGVDNSLKVCYNYPVSKGELCLFLRPYNK